MTDSNLHADLNKSNVQADHNLGLKSIWLSDNTRPWDIYSREQSRPQWDFGIHRSYSEEASN